MFEYVLLLQPLDEASHTASQKSVMRSFVRIALTFTRLSCLSRPIRDEPHDSEPPTGT
ncbi:hypothetical protein CUJ84_Chr004543 [Rhizobium leguminosarum]|uniref:Uncharacterized protein n=1 Tax=Rhizobium leguminosarum TaxID=384 RepID=A0A2K9Z9D9_RHILE|nr:hypothetical protein CUJ84_Chr004543 [Rhizobium leguminosarum]